MSEGPPSPAPSSLTPEQRSRIALQKQLALSRRTLREANKSQLSPPPPTSSLTAEQRSRIASQKQAALARRSLCGAKKSQLSLSSSPITGSQVSFYNDGCCSNPPVQYRPSVRQLFSVCESDRGIRKHSTDAEDFSGERFLISEAHGTPRITVVAQQQSSGIKNHRDLIQAVSAGTPNHGAFGSIGLRSCTNASCDANQNCAHAASISVPPKDYEIMLSKQQLDVLKVVAGTGKSFLLGCIIRILKKKLGPDVVYVTASTGLAACAIGGVTLHSFAGVDIAMEMDDMETMAAKVIGKQGARERWRRAEVLIIDEISMIDGYLFDKLEFVARVVRKTANRTVGIEDYCFGGIQLVVTGDFFQLPPVKPTDPNKYFAFEADCWDKCFAVQIELKHAFRHSEESFVELLNEIRTGNPSCQTLQVLGSRCRISEGRSSGVEATRLYAQKARVREEK